LAQKNDRYIENAHYQFIIEKKIGQEE